MDRKPLFDTVRRLLGGRLDRQQVAEIDRAIDAGLEPPAAAKPRVLGALSERYECGGKGPGTVSSGRGDPGGVSYGLFQLASRTGTCAAFVAAEGRRWAADFGEAVPGSAAFSAKWQHIAAREPAAFGQAQRDFIARTHYLPAVAAVKAATGLDLAGRHAAVRDACWSVAVQHGGAARILSAAVAAADGKAARTGNDYDRLLVEAIYDARSAYVMRVAGRAGIGAGERAVLTGLVRGRYAAERADALAMLDELPAKRPVDHLANP